ncbi:thiamine pyrophosphate-binding protein [Curvivirga sp.]|uniref:thiamine pyrophosphate-binding protein n=1 Tax=Curvivirga sp. TaxID=2856848 RepID=UPI003B59C7B3
MSSSSNARQSNERLGGHILADQLAIQGVDTVFCVPGESYLALLDGLVNHEDNIRVINTRHEGGASNMAEAYGKVTGRPGICMVTRGPGATNASCGLHTAYQDSTPMILFIGQVGRDMKDREAFQEIDYSHMFGQMAKWVAQIDSADRIPEYINRAFHVAMSGRPGPVVLALPEDMLTDYTAATDLKAPARVAQSVPAIEDLSELEGLLQKAKKPFMLVGGPTWTQDAVNNIVAFAEKHNIPTGASLRSQDCFDNTHRCYAGDVAIAVNPKLSKRVKESDLLIVAGPRLGEMTTQGYDLVTIPETAQTLVHVQTGAEELGRVYRPDLGFNCDMPSFAKAIQSISATGDESRAEWCASAHQDYLDRIQPTEVAGNLNMSKVVRHLSETLPADAIITAGAGNYAVWVHRFFQHKKFRTQVAPTNGAMGYSVPGALGAKAADPKKTVVSFSGDGCFMMLGQELATAIQFDLPVIFIVVNNGFLGTIRMHQERTYPERVMATDLHNPDFVQLGQAYGCHSELVTKTEDFATAFERAEQSGKAALLELRVDPEALTPVQSLSEVREQGKASI